MSCRGRHDQKSASAPHESSSIPRGSLVTSTHIRMPLNLALDKPQQMFLVHARRMVHVGVHFSDVVKVAVCKRRCLLARREARGGKAEVVVVCWRGTRREAKNQETKTGRREIHRAEAEAEEKKTTKTKTKTKVAKEKRNRKKVTKKGNRNAQKVSKQTSSFPGALSFPGTHLPSPISHLLETALPSPEAHDSQTGDHDSQSAIRKPQTESTPSTCRNVQKGAQRG